MIVLTFSAIGIFPSGRADRCWPVPYWTPFSTKVQYNEKRICDPLVTPPWRYGKYAHQGNYSKPIIRAETFHQHSPNIASQRYEYPRQGQEQNCNCLDLRASILHSHVSTHTRRPIEFTGVQQGDVQRVDRLEKKMQQKAIWENVAQRPRLTWALDGREQRITRDCCRTILLVQSRAERDRNRST